MVENIEQILNTIISRTQIVKLQGIEDEALSAYLQTNYETDASTALRIARFSDGNLNAALEYAQGAEHPHDALLREWLLLCLRIKGSQAAETSVKLIEFVEGIAKIGRENEKIFLKYFLWFLREASILWEFLPKTGRNGIRVCQEISYCFNYRYYRKTSGCN